MGQVHRAAQRIAQPGAAGRFGHERRLARIGERGAIERLAVGLGQERGEVGGIVEAAEGGAEGGGAERGQRGRIACAGAPDGEAGQRFSSRAQMRFFNRNARMVKISV
jgi:hypothetical protein